MTRRTRGGLVVAAVLLAVAYLAAAFLSPDGYGWQVVQLALGGMLVGALVGLVAGSMISRRRVGVRNAGPGSR